MDLGNCDVITLFMCQVAMEIGRTDLSVEIGQIEL